MDKETGLYVFWGLWVAANVATYLFIRKDWEIVTPRKERITWLCAVTHNTIIMLLIAKWRERRDTSE